MSRRALICRRIDAGLEKMRQAGMEPRAIYLCPSDYKLLTRASTRNWREQSGSRAYVWPCSYSDVPLIGEKLIAQMVPVRLTRKPGSAIYSTYGVKVSVPKRLSS